MVIGGPIAHSKPIFISNFHYIISFFSHKQETTKKNLCHNPVKTSNSFKNPKNLEILVTNPPSHYKQVILVTNSHLTISPVRVRLVWSSWSKGYKSIHICHIGFNIAKFHIFALFVFHDIVIYLICSLDSTLQIYTGSRAGLLQNAEGKTE